MYSALLLTLPILLIVAVILLIVRTHDLTSKQIVGLILTAVIAVILIVIVLVPVLDSSDDVRTDNTLYYDDYIQSPATSADGSLELITINSVQYAHAVGVGSGTLTYSDGTVATIDVQKAHLDVFLIMGQSNSAYFHAEPDLADPTPTLGTAYFYGVEGHPLFTSNDTCEAITDYDAYFTGCGMNSMNASDGLVKTGNFETPFSARWHDLTGHKVYSINTGVTAMPIQGLQPGKYGYTYAQQMFTRAMDAIDTSHYEVSFVSCIWAQGEGNAAMTVSTYKSNFLTIYHSLRGDSPPFSDVSTIKDMIIIQTNAEYAANPAQAQAELARDYAHIIMGTTVSQTFTIANGMLADDGVHYTQLADNKIGVELADTYFKVRG